MHFQLFGWFDLLSLHVAALVLHCNIQTTTAKKLLKCENNALE